MYKFRLVPLISFIAASLLISLLIPASIFASTQPTWLPLFLLLLAAGLLALALFQNVSGDGPPTQESASQEQIGQQLAQAKYSLMIEGVEDYAIFMLDPSGHIVSWNQGAVRINGYERDEILGKHFSLFYLPGAVQQEEPKEFLRLAEEKGSWQTQGWRRREDGSHYWADVLIASLTNAQGELVGFTNVVRDITQIHETQQQLKRSRDRLATAQEVANLGSWELDLADHEIQLSDQMKRIYGQDPATFTPSYEFFLNSQHAEDRPIVERIVSEAQDKGRDFEFQHRILRPEGEVRTLYAQGKVEVDEAGNPVRIIGTGQDISDRKDLEESLLIQSAISESIVETLNDLGMGILIFDERGILYSNPAMDKILQIEVGGFGSPIGLAAALEFEPDSSLSRILRYPTEPTEIMAGQTTMQGAEGLEYLEFAATLVSVGQEQRTILILRNITSQREDELRLKAAYKQIRHYARRQNRAIEEERARLSREIHDVLGQYLTIIKMDLWSLGQQIVKRDMKSSQELLKQVHELSRITDTTIRTARTIATELRPSVLDDLGLAAAIEWMAVDMANKSGFAVDHRFNSEFSDLDPEMATAIFRICQEALTNVARHAQASHVQVSLHRLDGHLELEIKDDGVGIQELDLSEKSKSLGLVGMRERVTAVNGNIVIAPRYSKGTVVQVTVPLKGDIS